MPLHNVIRRMLKGDEEIDWKLAFERSIEMSGVIEDGKWANDVTEKEKQRLIDEWKDEKIDYMKSIPNAIKTFFVEKAYFPNPVLYDRTLKLVSLLEVATDGLLFKLKNTGEFIPTKKAVSGLPLSDFTIEELPRKIPIVSGDVEVVEVKSDKAYIDPHQKNAYSVVLENGYKLRYFHVFIVSFVDNNFEIEERIIENVNELTEAINFFRKMAQKRYLRKA